MANTPRHDMALYRDATPNRYPKMKLPDGKTTAPAPMNSSNGALVLEPSRGGPDQCNRFFGGICLALPLSALLWVLGYFLLQVFLMP